MGVGGFADSGRAAPTGAPVDLLPDLVQERPADLALRRSQGRLLLGFRSSVQNVGAGPLVIVGSRPGRTTRDMRADQVIRRSDGSTRRVRGIGLVRYVASPDHSHWHFAPFERYELRRSGAAVRLVRDAKTGFCLGDRYRVEPRPAGSARAPVFVSRCGLGRTGLLRITEGISVGWADDYGAYLDGQHIDVTGLPSGRYRLVHVVNASGRIRESNHTNNSASVLIELTRTAARVGVRAIRGAPPG